MKKIGIRFSNVISKLFTLIKLTPFDKSTESGISNERYRRIILTGDTAFVSKIVHLFITLIIIPLTVNYLGAERYGMWMTVTSILGFMVFADLGLGNGLLNAISRANGRDSDEEAQFAVSSTFILLLGIACLLGIIFYFIYPFIPWQYIFNVKSNIAISESGPTVLVVVFFFLINLPVGIIQRIQHGYQEGYITILWLILGSVLSLLAIVFCVNVGAGLPWLVFSSLIGPLIATLLNGIILFSFSRRYLRPSFKYINFSVGGRLIKTGLVFVLLQSLSMMVHSSDNIIIAQILGSSYVAQFAVTQRLFMFTLMTSILMRPLWPAFGESIARGDFKWSMKILKKGLIISIFSGMILALPLLFFGKQIIEYWIGEDYVPTYFMLLGFYMFIVLSGYTGVITTFLNSGPLLRKQIGFMSIASIIAVLTKIILVKFIGIDGAIWSTVLVFGIFYVRPSYKLAFNYLDRMT